MTSEKANTLVAANVCCTCAAWRPEPTTASSSFISTSSAGAAASGSFFGFLAGSLAAGLLAASRLPLFLPAGVGRQQTALDQRLAANGHGGGGAGSGSTALQHRLLRLLQLMHGEAADAVLRSPRTRPCAAMITPRCPGLTCHYRGQWTPSTDLHVRLCKAT
jgi:hypothetical protein